MTAIPTEFEDLLSSAGRRVLAGKDAALCGALADPRRRFISHEGLIKKKAAEGPAQNARARDAPAP